MDPTQLGMNRTGLQMSPLDAEQLLSGARDFEPELAGDATVLGDFRSSYIIEAEPVGSVPLPGSLTGMARSGVKMLQGERLQVLIDKLGERLAFERGGTRLYDALIAKCQHRDDELAGIDLALLQQFRTEEAQHVLLVAEAIEELGGDPTAQTPCADVSAVASMGLMQVALDPRTSVAQTMQAMLAAELVDRDGWELLILLTREAGYDDIAKRFEGALAQEAVHLEHVRRWHQQAAQGALTPAKKRRH
jgi:ferritin-like protein